MGHNRRFDRRSSTSKKRPLNRGRLNRKLTAEVDVELVKEEKVPARPQMGAVTVGHSKHILVLSTTATPTRSMRDIVRSVLVRKADKQPELVTV